jgi:hypothetical protein
MPSSTPVPGRVRGRRRLPKFLQYGRTCRWGGGAEKRSFEGLTATGRPAPTPARDRPGLVRAWGFLLARHRTPARRRSGLGVPPQTACVARLQYRPWIDLNRANMRHAAPCASTTPGIERLRGRKAHRQRRLCPQQRACFVCRPCDRVPPASLHRRAIWERSFGFSHRMRAAGLLPQRHLFERDGPSFQPGDSYW